MHDVAVSSENIALTGQLIRPYIRRTPIIEVVGADLGLNSTTLVFKLESLQHAGSFKTRGAFASLLTRAVPQAGVVAASGGNHGAAVAFAAMRLAVPASIFVPSVASPTKMDRIRSYGANLVISGERYADALIASENWAQKSGALAVHAYDQGRDTARTRDGRIRVRGAGSGARHAARSGWRGRSHRRYRGVVFRPD